MVKEEKDVEVKGEAAPRQEITWKALVTWIEGRITQLETADAKVRLNESFRLGQLDVLKDLKASLENFDNVKDEMSAK